LDHASGSAAPAIQDEGHIVLLAYNAFSTTDETKPAH
jgi:hypothetical protein